MSGSGARGRRREDVVVIGGGPAGATAAALLSAWGWSVVLLHHEAGPHSLAESLPPSIRKLLAFVGALDTVEAAGFHPNDGNVSRWGGSSAVAATSTPGYHVARAAFDAALRQRARAGGATIVDALVQHVDTSGQPAVECTTIRGARRYRPSFVLDCSGRAGVVARRGLRRADAGYRTLALTAEWASPGWPEEERTHTFIDSYGDGWAWSVPLSATRRQCTVMIDAGQVRVRKAQLGDVYATELGKAASIVERLSGGRHLSAPWACDASVYDCLRAHDSGVLLAGDAASFIEPLSSAGVKKALASAWRAAVVVNTALRSPGMRQVACEYHDRREHEVYAECTRRSAAFFRDAAAFYGHEFWEARAAYSPEPVRSASPPGGLASDEDTRRVLQRLRDASSLNVRPAPSLRFEPVPVIEGREIVFREAVAAPGLAQPLRFLEGIDVPAIVRLAGACRDVGALIARYEQDVGAADSRMLLVGLSRLIAGGLLVEHGREL